MILTIVIFPHQIYTSGFSTLEVPFSCSCKGSKPNKLLLSETRKNPKYVVCKTCSARYEVKLNLDIPRPSVMIETVEVNDSFDKKLSITL